VGSLEEPRRCRERVTVRELSIQRDPGAPIRLLCLGAHSDDIEIGCGATILRLTELYAAAAIRWIVFGAADDRRREEALAGADAFLARAAEKEVVVKTFRDGWFPAAAGAIKECFEEIKSGPAPDLIFTHYRHDLHQDHKLLSDLTWNTFRGSFILEYEVPKWDGDLGTPNCYVRVSDEITAQKVRTICEVFASQRGKPWFTAETFRALMRLRGVESNTPFAEAFYARKMVLG
jgi:LmbE family N-acetylglucosaminyl deacetylase